MSKSSLHIYLIVITIFGSLLYSCSDYNKVLKSTDTEEKWDFASSALDSGSCFKALPLLEELVSLTRGTQRAEEVQSNMLKLTAVLMTFIWLATISALMLKLFLIVHLLRR